MTPESEYNAFRSKKMFAKLLLGLIVDRKNVTYLKIAYHEEASCGNPTQMSCPRSCSFHSYMGITLFEAISNYRLNLILIKG